MTPGMAVSWYQCFGGIYRINVQDEIATTKKGAICWYVVGAYLPDYEVSKSERPWSTDLKDEGLIRLYGGFDVLLSTS
jgi:hypothetical protein